MKYDDREDAATILARSLFSYIVVATLAVVMSTYAARNVLVTGISKIVLNAFFNNDPTGKLAELFPGSPPS